MIKRWILYILLVGVTGASAFGQQSSPPSGESHKDRTILTLAGGGGGFAVGLSKFGTRSVADSLD